MMLAKKLLLTPLLFLGVNAIGSTFAYSYWNTAASGTANGDTSLVIGSFPYGEEVEDGDKVCLDRGDSITYNGSTYVALVDLGCIKVKPKIEWDAWDKLNKVTDEYDITNYYDGWSKPLSYVTDRGTTALAQPVHEEATETSPTSKHATKYYYLDVQSSDLSYWDDMPYPAIGMVAEQDGTYYRTVRAAESGDSPEDTEDWGRRNPWQEIPEFRRYRTYYPGDYVVCEEQVYLVTEKTDWSSSPNLDHTTFRPYKFTTYIDTEDEDSVLVHEYMEGYRYLPGELVLRGYDSVDRALIYQVKDELKDGTLSDPRHDAYKEYTQIFDPLLD